MGQIHKEVTAAAQAANQANGAQSAGPETEAGKAQSKMNAFKHGKYAQRPDPVALMLAGDPEAEAAERAAMRTEMAGCFEPADDFARQQAEELADLKFELRRIERAKEVVEARERELLELEQRRRAYHLQQAGITWDARQGSESGLMRALDCGPKFQTILSELGWLAEECEKRDFSQAAFRLRRVYGNSNPLWSGQELFQAAQNADGGSEEDLKHLQGLLHDEIEDVKERQALFEQEYGPLSETGLAARLLEAMGSRRWAWVRQQENALRKSIERQVRVLIDLRRDHARAEREAAVSRQRSAVSRPEDVAAAFRPARSGIGATVEEDGVQMEAGVPSGQDARARSQDRGGQDAGATSQGQGRQDAGATTQDRGGQDAGATTQDRGGQDAGATTQDRGGQDARATLAVGEKIGSKPRNEPTISFGISEELSRVSQSTEGQGVGNQGQDV